MYDHNFCFTVHPQSTTEKKSRGHTPVIEENLLIHSDTNV